jgi:hypothetical protein
MTFQQTLKKRQQATKCLLNGAVRCYSKYYLRSTFGVGDRTRLRNRTTAQTQTLYAIAPRQFSHSRTGTFNCRTKSTAPPKQFNKPAFPTHGRTTNETLRGLLKFYKQTVDL